MSTENGITESTAKDFFMRLLAIIALYICASSFIDMCYQYINAYFPDEMDRYFIFSLRWDIASFIVSFPVYLYTTIWSHRECKQHPEKLNLKSRKWLINLTLFFAALVVMGDLGTLIYYFLGNPLTLRFLLKVLVLLIVAGFIFYYYLRDLKCRWTAAQSKILFWFVLIIGILVVGCSIYKIEKPIFLLSSRTPIPYCQWKTLPVTADEDKVIQQLVKGFATRNSCYPGNNCLNKWNDHGVTKFSIAWDGLCSAGGDGGHGSTFQCRYIGKNVCCSVLGWGYKEVCLTTPAASAGVPGIIRFD
jgi:hypothetical protein